MSGPRLWYSGAVGEAAPEGFDQLDECSVLPRDLLPRMADATVLAVAEPRSFPFETLRRFDWDVPMAVALPSGGRAAVSADLGEVALSRLGRMDRVACTPETWLDVAGDTGWVDEMRSDSLASAVETLGERQDKERFRARAVVIARLARTIPWESFAVFGDSPIGTRLSGSDTGGAPGAADLVLVTDPAPAALPGRWWGARSERGSLVVVARVVGSDVDGVGELRDAILAAGPSDASVGRVVSVAEPGRAIRRDAVLEFGVE